MIATAELYRMRQHADMHPNILACCEPTTPELRALHVRSITHHAVEFQIDLQRLRAFIVLMDSPEKGC